MKKVEAKQIWRRRRNWTWIEKQKQRKRLIKTRIQIVR